MGHVPVIFLSKPPFMGIFHCHVWLSESIFPFCHMIYPTVGHICPYLPDYIILLATSFWLQNHTFWFWKTSRDFSKTPGNLNIVPSYLGKFEYFTNLNSGHRRGWFPFMNYHLWWGRNEVVIIYSDLIPKLSAMFATSQQGFPREKTGAGALPGTHACSGGWEESKVNRPSDSNSWRTKVVFCFDFPARACNTIIYIYMYICICVYIYI